MSQSTHEEESEVEVGERCPGEEELDRVVDELELKEDLPEEALTRAPDAEEEHCRVYTGKE